jgi:hypothetical protein
MELNDWDLKALMAASMLRVTPNPRFCTKPHVPSDIEIEAAIEIAEEIWKEFLRRKRILG